MDTIIGKIGRIVYGLIMVVFASFHFMNAGEMAAAVPLPGGVFWVYITGIALLGAGISLIIQKKVQLVALLLGIMLLVFAFSVHLPGVINAQDDMAMQIAMGTMLRDIALASAAFFFSGVYTNEEESSDSGQED